MASIITATTANGLVSSADNSGVLQLASGTGNLVTIPAVTGTAMVSANMPTFSAIQNAATALSAGTSTKVNFQLEQWDTNNNYNTSNSRFTPTVAGYYQISSTVRADIASNSVLHIYVRKNGTDEYAGNFIGTTSSQCATTVSCLLFLNGSTDYVEIAVFSSSAGNTAGTNQASFQGCLVRAS
jgi:hypothetical protein